MADKPVIISDENSGKQLELPVVRGTAGEPTLSIKSLPKELGYFTYDRSALCSISSVGVAVPSTTGTCSACARFTATSAAP